MTHYPPPPERDARQYPPSQGTGPYDTGHNYGAAPGQGFTPPVFPASAPPPQGMPAAVRGYVQLRQRARASSMSWWLFKLLQGALMGVPLVTLGIVVTLSASVVAGQWLTVCGILVVLIGLAVLLRYALAPITCHWIVIVPEGHYWVVVDSNDFTLRFLASGPQHIAWNWGVRVKDYANFTWVSLSILEQNVLPPDGPVDVEVGVTMRFEPSRAAPEQFADLREMIRREMVERLLARSLRTVVRDTLQRRPPQERLKLLGQKYHLEQIIMQRLAPLTAWGLFPIAARPVSVFVDRLPHNAYANMYDEPYADPYTAPQQAPAGNDPPVARTASETRIGLNMRDTVSREDASVSDTPGAAPTAGGGRPAPPVEPDPPRSRPLDDDLHIDPMTRRSRWKNDKRD